MRTELSVFKMPQAESGSREQLTTKNRWHHFRADFAGMHDSLNIHIFEAYCYSFLEIILHTIAPVGEVNLASNASFHKDFLATNP